MDAQTCPPPPQQYFCWKTITFFTEQIFIIFPDRGGLNFLRELIFSFLRGGGGGGGGRGIERGVDFRAHLDCFSGSQRALIIFLNVSALSYENIRGGFFKRVMIVM